MYMIMALTNKVGLTDRSSSRLEESKEKVHRNDEEVSEDHTEREEVEPKRDGDQEQTRSASEQTDGKYGSGIEGIAQLAGNDVSGGVGTHEDGVHLGEDEGVVPRIRLELLLDGGVAFAGEVRHEVATECDEEGPSMKVKGEQVVVDDMRFLRTIDGEIQWQFPSMRLV